MEKIEVEIEDDELQWLERYAKEHSQTPSQFLASVYRLYCEYRFDLSLLTKNRFGQMRIEDDLEDK